MRRVRVAEIDLVLTGGPDREGGGAGPMVVLMHGYGAPAEDLLPLSRQLQVDSSVRFAFPAAPHAAVSVASGRAWWQLDMVELQQAMLQHDYVTLSERVPAGLAEARERVEALLDALEQEHGAARDKLVLGGFSQGAMLATDVTLRAARPPAALVILSGSLIARAEWEPLMPSRAGLPVLQSHGRADPVLPYEVAETLRQKLSAAGLAVEFHAFNGGHGIPDGVMTALAKLVARVTS
jgi:phospholipase/carboxylesterase